MNKQVLLERIQAQLEQTLQIATEAAMRAYNTATDDENVAENKYDTFALEASYLAHGQAQRVAECKADISAYQHLLAAMPIQQDTVVVGHLVSLEDHNGNLKLVFLGPAAGGLKFTVDGLDVIIVTPTSPFGEALLGREIDEEVDVHIGDNVVWFDVVSIE
ncbi:transcription elongation factor [Photobacterium kishitanii]|uniref:Transcription elongation factor n=1 Tax=Photobacterium kishitanii TaxID=318456 RepID=A0A0B7JHG7_9GAMM|nr:GreA/GreB family elongation factor [Photobacterium kishitanii]OBU23842.1 transcription elongation factor [Photobacterium kishitanii]PSU91821.1 transcription elongation factor [Photobacterium kishitanii]PSU92838.1 transcription elongation factor [Photobacterium kishitanii]PSU93053.1 transcription elongation factor [Photobacterium kishitanii]PSV20324.1 transcription elongation factor [Photobacterium kishitanii]